MPASALATNENLVPLDIAAMLLGRENLSSEAETAAYLPADYMGHIRDLEHLTSFADVLCDPPTYPCRRVSTFPISSRHALPKPSNLRLRSLSESACLNNNNTELTIEDVKRGIQTLYIQITNSQHRKGSLSSDEGSCDSSPLNSPTQVTLPCRPSLSPKKKRVMFADDVGKELHTIRVMTEGSDIPPKLDPAIIRAVLGDEYEEPRADATWELDFKQPCCEYLAFRDRLASQNVALENVVLRNDTCHLMGTVKVRNSCFEKDLFVRFTENNWISYFDKPAKFSGSVPGDPYDTFAFDFEIPPDDDMHKRLEFCVCVRSGGQEFWDSNSGKNFVVISQRVKSLWGRQEAEEPAAAEALAPKKHSDAFMMDYGTKWGQFASWKDLDVEGPYW